MGDMIDRDAALAIEGQLAKSMAHFLRVEQWQAYKAGVQEYRDAIAALEPVTQPAPDAAFASGFKAGLKAAAEHWFRGVSGVRQLLPETKAQILAIPCPQPAPAAIRDDVADLADFLDAKHKSYMAGLGRNPADYVSGYSTARDKARAILAALRAGENNGR